MDALQSLTSAASASALSKREPGETAARRDAVPTEIKPPSDSAAATSPLVVASMNESAGSAVTKRGQEDKSKEQSPEEVAAAVEDINDFFKSMQRTMQFSLDKEGERMVVQIKDAEGNVVKQIPSEQALELARRLGEVKGLLLEEQA